MDTYYTDNLKTYSISSVSCVLISSSCRFALLALSLRLMADSGRTGPPPPAPPLWTVTVTLLVLCCCFLYRASGAAVLSSSSLESCTQDGSQVGIPAVERKARFPSSTTLYRCYPFSPDAPFRPPSAPATDVQQEAGANSVRCQRPGFGHRPNPVHPQLCGQVRTTLFPIIGSAIGSNINDDN